MASRSCVRSASLQVCWRAQPVSRFQHPWCGPGYGRTTPFVAGKKTQYKRTLLMELQLNGRFEPATTTLHGEDRVTLYGWSAVAGSVIGYSMDGFDLLIVGFMLAAISSD